MKKNVVHVIKSQLPGETKIDSFKVWPLNNHAKAKKHTNTNTKTLPEIQT